MDPNQGQIREANVGMSRSENDTTDVLEEHAIKLQAAHLIQQGQLAQAQRAGRSKLRVS